MVHSDRESHPFLNDASHRRDNLIFRARTVEFRSLISGSSRSEDAVLYYFVFLMQPASLPP